VLDSGFAGPLLPRPFLRDPTVLLEHLRERHNGGRIAREERSDQRFNSFLMFERRTPLMAMYQRTREESTFKKAQECCTTAAQIFAIHQTISCAYAHANHFVRLFERHF